MSESTGVEKKEPTGPIALTGSGGVVIPVAEIMKVITDGNRTET